MGEKDLINTENEEISNYINSEHLGSNIALLKHNLASTDWIVVKIMECENESERTVLKEKYAEVIAQRKEWRERINKLEESE